VARFAIRSWAGADCGGSAGLFRRMCPLLASCLLRKFGFNSTIFLVISSSLRILNLRAF